MQPAANPSPVHPALPPQPAHRPASRPALSRDNSMARPAGLAGQDEAAQAPPGLGARRVSLAAEDDAGPPAFHGHPQAVADGLPMEGEAPPRPALEHRSVRFESYTQPGEWQATHRLAQASTRPLEQPASFRMDWPLQHGRLFGAGDLAQKVGFALTHLSRCRQTTGPHTLAGQYRDMRPLMQAGVELALRNSGDRIRPGQACQLVDELLRQARDPFRPQGLEPDELRMMVAGLVAVWDPLVSNEVAMHLLQQVGEASAPAQLQAAAEGLGIGMGWKGMALIHQSFSQLPRYDRTPSAGELLQRMNQGQSVGKGWLLRLEQSLHGMQGHALDDGYAHLKTVALLRKHYVRHDTPTLEEATAHPPLPAGQALTATDTLDDSDEGWLEETAGVEGRARAESQDDEDSAPTATYRGTFARPPSVEAAEPDETLAADPRAVGPPRAGGR